MNLTPVVLHFNDESASVLRIEVNDIEMELVAKIHQWLNGDYADGVTDAMSFQGPGTGFVVIHRSQVLYAEVGQVNVPVPVTPDLPPPPAPKGRSILDRF